MRRGISLSSLPAIAALSLTTILLACSSSTPSGKEVFSKEFCPACHYFRGLGRMEGIDISRVGERRSAGWIREHIINPKTHDPNIGMPNHSHLTSAELDALVRMLTSPTSPPTPPIEEPEP